MTTPDPNNDPGEFILNDFIDTGANINILPAKNSSFRLDLNECGGGNLSVPASSVAAGLIKSGQVVIVKYRGAIRGGFFVEHINETIANAGEGAELWKTISGRGILALLDDGIVWPDAEGTGSREFTSTKAGILYNLITEADARGTWIPTLDFSATTDSESVAWTDSELMEFSAGKSLLDVAREVAEMGIDINSTIDSTGSITLSAYKNEFGSNKATTIKFRIGKECIEVGSSEAGDEIRNALAVKYSNGFLFTNDAVSIAERRRREAVIDAQDAGNAANALNYGNAILEYSKDSKVEKSVQVYDGVGVRVFIDYGLGDYITIDKNGTEAIYRIRSLQLSWDDDEKASVVVGLNSIILENEIRMARNLKKLQEKWRREGDPSKIIVNQWFGLGLSSDTTGGYVQAIALDVVNNVLFVGGSFAQIGGVSADNIAKYDINSKTWSSVGGQLNSQVIALVISGDDLFVGGSFTNADGISTADYVAKYSISGNTWASIGGQLNDSVTALAVSGDDLFVGGIFTNVAGVSIYSIAKYSISGDVWSGIGGQIFNYVKAVAISGDDLFAGGWFVDADGEVTADKIAKYSISGGTWSSIGGQLNNNVAALAISGDDLFVGGAFTDADGIATADRIAKYSISGGTWSSIGGGLDNSVNALTVFGDDLFVGGSFTNYDYIAKYSISGNTWASIGGELNNGVYALAMSGDDLFVGGLFTTVEGRSSKMMAVYIHSLEDVLDELGGGGNSITRWGNIIGTLANQGDLKAKLDLITPPAATAENDVQVGNGLGSWIKKTLAEFSTILQTSLDGVYLKLPGWITGIGTWSYSSADAPSFVISINADVTALISVGMRIKLTQTTVKYFIVTAVGAYGGGATLVTVYGGTDYTLANAAITVPFYSSEKIPFGFPADPLKWTVSASSSSDCLKDTPTVSTWYGDTGLSATGPSLSIPIGAWRVDYKGLISSKDTTVVDFTIYSTLSTASNSESDSRFTAGVVLSAPSGSYTIFGPVFVQNNILLASKTTYYFNVKSNISTADNIRIRGDVVASTIKAVCAYL